MCYFLLDFRLLNNLILENDLLILIWIMFGVNYKCNLGRVFLFLCCGILRFISLVFWKVKKLGWELLYGCFKFFVWGIFFKEKILFFV